MYENRMRRAADELSVKRFDACYAVLDVKYDPCFPYEIILEGVRYNVGVFEGLGTSQLGMKEGELYRLEKRDDGVIWISRITDDSVLTEARRLFDRETFDAAVRVEVERLRNRTAWQRFKERINPRKRK